MSCPILRSIISFFCLLYGIHSAHASQLVPGPDGSLQKVPSTRLPDSPTLVDREKCYGVTRRGDEMGLSVPDSVMNAERYRPQDGDGYAWIELPFGLCSRIVGGSLVPRAPDNNALSEMERRLLGEADSGEKIESTDDLIEQRIRNFLYR